MSTTRRRLVTGSIGVAAVTSMPAVGASVGPDSDLIALCERFNVLEQRAKLLIAAGGDDTAIEARNAPELARIDAEQGVLLDRIDKTRAATFDGVKARLRMINLYSPFDPGLPSSWDWGDRMCVHFLRDVDALLADMQHFADRKGFG